MSQQANSQECCLGKGGGLFIKKGGQKRYVSALKKPFSSGKVHLPKQTQFSFMSDQKKITVGYRNFKGPGGGKVVDKVVAEKGCLVFDWKVEVLTDMTKNCRERQVEVKINVQPSKHAKAAGKAGVASAFDGAMNVLLSKDRSDMVAKLGDTCYKAGEEVAKTFIFSVLNDCGAPVQALQAVADVAGGNYAGAVDTGISAGLSSVFRIPMVSHLAVPVRNSGTALLFAPEVPGQQVLWETARCEMLKRFFYFCRPGVGIPIAFVAEVGVGCSRTEKHCTVPGKSEFARSDLLGFYCGSQSLDASFGYGVRSSAEKRVATDANGATVTTATSKFSRDVFGCELRAGDRHFSLQTDGCCVMQTQSKHTVMPNGASLPGSVDIDGGRVKGKVFESVERVDAVSDPVFVDGEVTRVCERTLEREKFLAGEYDASREFCRHDEKGRRFVVEEEHGKFLSVEKGAKTQLVMESTPIPSIEDMDKQLEPKGSKTTSAGKCVRTQVLVKDDESGKTVRCEMGTSDVNRSEESGELKSSEQYDYRHSSSTKKGNTIVKKTGHGQKKTENGELKEFVEHNDVSSESVSETKCAGLFQDTTMITKTTERYVEDLELERNSAMQQLAEAVKNTPIPAVTARYEMTGKTVEVTTYSSNVLFNKTLTAVETFDGAGVSTGPPKCFQVIELTKHSRAGIQAGKVAMARGAVTAVFHGSGPAPKVGDVALGTVKAALSATVSSKLGEMLQGSLGPKIGATAANAAVSVAFNLLSGDLQAAQSSLFSAGANAIVQKMTELPLSVSRETFVATKRMFSDRFYQSVVDRKSLDYNSSVGVSAGIHHDSEESAFEDRDGYMVHRKSTGVGGHLSTACGGNASLTLSSGSERSQDKETIKGNVRCIERKGRDFDGEITFKFQAGANAMDFKLLPAFNEKKFYQRVEVTLDGSPLETSTVAIEKLKHLTAVAPPTVISPPTELLNDAGGQLQANTINSLANANHARVEHVLQREVYNEKEKRAYGLGKKETCEDRCEKGVAVESSAKLSTPIRESDEYVQKLEVDQATSLFERHDIDRTKKSSAVSRTHRWSEHTESEELQSRTRKSIETRVKEGGYAHLTQESSDPDGQRHVVRTEDDLMKMSVTTEAEDFSSGNAVETTRMEEQMHGQYREDSVERPTVTTEDGLVTVSHKSGVRMGQYADTLERSDGDNHQEFARGEERQETTDYSAENTTSTTEAAEGASMILAAHDLGDVKGSDLRGRGTAFETSRIRTEFEEHNYGAEQHSKKDNGISQGVYTVESEPEVKESARPGKMNGVSCELERSVNFRETGTYSSTTETGCISGATEDSVKQAVPTEKFAVGEKDMEMTATSCHEVKRDAYTAVANAKGEVEYLRHRKTETEQDTSSGGLRRTSNSETILTLTEAERNFSEMQIAGEGAEDAEVRRFVEQNNLQLSRKTETAKQCATWNGVKSYSWTKITKTTEQSAAKTFERGAVEDFGDASVGKEGALDVVAKFNVGGKTVTRESVRGKIFSTNSTVKTKVTDDKGNVVSEVKQKEWCANAASTQAATTLASSSVKFLSGCILEKKGRTWKEWKAFGKTTALSTSMTFVRSHVEDIARCCSGKSQFAVGTALLALSHLDKATQRELAGKSTDKVDAVFDTIEQSLTLLTIFKPAACLSKSGAVGIVTAVVSLGRDLFKLHKEKGCLTLEGLKESLVQFGTSVVSLGLGVAVSALLTPLMPAFWASILGGGVFVPLLIIGGGHFLKWAFTLSEADELKQLCYKLGLANHACSHAEFRAAIRHQALVCHPDKPGGSKERFCQLMELADRVAVLRQRLKIAEDGSAVSEDDPWFQLTVHWLNRLRNYLATLRKASMSGDMNSVAAIQCIFDDQI